MIVTKEKATHELCRLDPTKRSKGNKWVAFAYLKFEDTVTGNQAASFVLANSLATAREIRRSHVRLLQLRGEKQINFQSYEEPTEEIPPTENAVSDDELVAGQR